LAATRDGAGAAATASMYTSPVNQSAGPLTVSIELRVICTVVLLWASGVGEQVRAPPPDAGATACRDGVVRDAAAS
jgi:hypothetical protein